MFPKTIFILLLAGGALLAQAPLPSDVDPQSYSRLPLIKRSSLDEKNQKIFDFVNLGKVQENPRVGPPANTLYSPEMAEPFDHLNQVLRKTVAGSKYFEICTLVAAREYDQQYEWTGHEVAAQRAGVEQNVIDAIKFNKSVDDFGEKERVLIQFGRDLLRKHKAEPAQFAKMVDLFGRQGTIELTATIGDYVMTAIVLNAVDQHLPPERKPLLPPK